MFHHSDFVISVRVLISPTATREHYYVQVILRKTGDRQTGEDRQQEDRQQEDRQTGHRQTGHRQTGDRRIQDEHPGSYFRELININVVNIPYLIL